jgi:hypothetical protein
MFDDVGEEVAGRDEIFAKRRHLTYKCKRRGCPPHHTPERISCHWKPHNSNSDQELVANAFYQLK